MQQWVAVLWQLWWILRLWLHHLLLFLSESDTSTDHINTDAGTDERTDNRADPISDLGTYVFSDCLPNRCANVLPFLGANVVPYCSANGVASSNAFNDRLGDWDRCRLDWRHLRDFRCWPCGCCGDYFDYMLLEKQELLLLRQGRHHYSRIRAGWRRNPDGHRGQPNTTPLKYRRREHRRYPNLLHRSGTAGTASSSTSGVVVRRSGRCRASRS